MSQYEQAVEWVFAQSGLSLNNERHQQIVREAVKYGNAEYYHSNPFTKEEFRQWRIFKTRAMMYCNRQTHY